MTTQQQQFINSILSGAKQGYQKYGIFASVTIAQAIEESGWGGSYLAHTDYNLFGIKYPGNHDPSLIISQGSWATDDGGYYTHYNSWSDSILDHGYFLAHNSIYRNALTAKTPAEQIQAIARAGYATEANYYDVVMDKINTYNLTQYDNGTYVETLSLETENNDTSTNGTLAIPETNFTVTGEGSYPSSILFGRRFRLLVSNDNGVALDVSKLRCSFNIQKTMQMQANYSTVTIYNLSAKTENTIINEGNKVILEAGYEGEQYGKIYEGTVIQPIRDKQDGVNYLLTLNCLDGDGFLNGGVVNFSLSKGQTHRDVTNSLTSKASFPTSLNNISQSLGNTSLIRGKVCFGLSKDYLRQIAISNNASLYIEDGKVNIIQASDLPNDEIIELSPMSGLIGVPAQTEYGVSFTCLLNPKIKINSLVHIDNSYIHDMQAQIGQVIRSLDSSGIYRIIKVVHNGDSWGDNWFTQCETISQAGLAPALLQTTGNSFS